MKIKYTSIVRFMHTAQAHLQYPKMRVHTLSNVDLQFSIAGERAKFPGSINITDGGGYANSVFFGRILKDGTLQSYRDAPCDLEQSLDAINADPYHAAKLYGDATSECCFCNRRLTHPDSVFNGYGAICAGHYGMPYVTGNKAREQTIVMSDKLPQVDVEADFHLASADMPEEQLELKGV